MGDMSLLEPQIRELVDLLTEGTKSGVLKWEPAGSKHVTEFEGGIVEVFVAIDPPRIFFISAGGCRYSTDCFHVMDGISLLSAIYAQEQAAGLSPLTKIVDRLRKLVRT